MFEGEFTLRTLYVIFQIIGSVILVGELFYVGFQKPSNFQKLLLYILFTVLISTCGYLIELIAVPNSVTSIDPILQAEEYNAYLRTAYIGCSVGYLGKPFALVSALLLLFEYSNIKVPTKFTLPLLLFFLFLTSMVVTNQYHHLYYGKVGINLDKSGSPLEVTHGPFWYVYIVSSIVIFLFYIAIVIYEYRRCKNRQAKQMAILLLLVVVFAFLGLLLFMTGLTKNYDTTMLGIEIGTIFLLILFSKYKIFDTLTLAERKALNDSDDGVIVLDARNRISYYNETALKIVPNLNKVNKENEVINQLENIDTDEPLFINSNIYDLNISTVTTGKNERTVGKTFLFKQITYHHQYQERLNNEIEEATKKITSIQRTALISIADIVEARDGNTGAHVKSVSYTAKRIAERLAESGPYKRSLTPTMINIIEECAPLHDIGKIYISDSILNKPGKLTSEEFEEMKKHTTLGGEIINKTIAGIEEPLYVRIANNIALYHHERFDGTGYPSGLKGTKIPLCARIMAVADVYDALRMKRAYKDAFDKETALKIIKEENGTHFDPVVVDAFLDIVDTL